MPEPTAMGAELPGNGIDAQVRIFQENRSLFANLCEILVTVLKDGAKTLPGGPIVQGRVKETDSFVEKCIRKRAKYAQPAWQLTDLCGARVILLSQDDIPNVCRFIETHFLIHEHEDTLQRLKEVEFGYQSVHYIVSLKSDLKDWYAALCPNIPESLFAVRSIEEAMRVALPPGPVFKAEIQVRTLLQHAWSAAVHDNLYKTELKRKPRHLMREAALIAAQVEEADASIVRLIRGVQAYSSHYGAYLTPEEIRQELQLQRIVLDHNPGNTGAALKMARLADCLGDPAESARVEEVLARFESRDDDDLLRELGMLRWRLGKKALGREDLLAASRVRPDDPDTLCELGTTYLEEEDYPHALGYFDEAFRQAPYHPRALTGFAQCRILSGDEPALAFIPLIRLHLEKAIDASLRRIGAGVHLPYAWYDIGFFELLLGRPYETLTAYAKAVWTTSSAAPVQAVYDLLTRMQQTVADHGSDFARTLTWMRSFLRVVLVGRYHALPAESLSDGDLSMDGFPALAPSARRQKAPPFSPEAPIVIVAGTCSKASQPLMAQYEPLLHKAFTDFTGTICCGGTADGISGIVGRLDGNGKKIRRVAYLPRDQQHMRSYARIDTVSGSFSPLDPLMLWGDLLWSGVAPGTVRLLGIRGGEISAFEYQLALLLGARVGVLPESGGAAYHFAADPDWSCPGGPSEGAVKSHLLRLPTDVETLRAFIHPSTPSGMIDPVIREQMAANLHEGYSKDARDKHYSMLPGNIAPWDKLTPTFKAANLGQVDHIENKLRSVGLALRKTTDRKPALYAFTQEQLNLLAEMEHGRWVVERLEDGWTLGERDDLKKTRPQLVPWAALPDLEKLKDFAFIERLPEILAKEGYEIVGTKDGK